MAIKLPVSAVTLNYICDEDGETWSQPASDVTEVGTLICPVCADDMRLVDVTVTGENESYPTRIIDDVTVAHALSPDYGTVILMVEATAVSFGTRFACFKPLEGTKFSTPLIELERGTPAVVVRVDTVEGVR